MAISSKKTVMKNTVILYIRMIITLVVSLYTSRVTLQLLGVDDFGVYGVVGSIVGLFAFLSRSLAAALNRFFCASIADDDTESLRKILGATHIIQWIIIGLVLIICEIGGLWFIRNYMVVASEKIAAVYIVFQFSIATFIVSIYSTIYNCIVISLERMTIYAYLCIFEVVAKLIVTFALGLLDEDRLIYYSIFIFGVQLVTLFLYYIFVKKHYPLLTPNFKDCRAYVKRMLSFAGYGFIGSFGFVVKNQSLNFLLNIFGGPVLNAARTISFQVYTAVYNFVGNFQTAFSPYMLKNQHIDQYNTCNRDITIFTHLSFVTMTILMIPIIFATDEILHVWLGNNVPQWTAYFTRIILIIGLCEAISSPLQNIIYADGRIKMLQYLSLFANVSVIAVSWIMLKQGLNSGVVYVTDLVGNIFLVFVRIMIASRNTDLNIQYYIKRTALPIIMVLIPLYGLYYISLNQIIPIWVGISLSELLTMVFAVAIMPRHFFISIKNFLK